MSGRSRRNKERLPVMRMSGRNRREGIYTWNNNGLEDREYWISSVLGCLIKNNNRMKLGKLQKKVENEHKRKYPDFESEIRRHSTLFSLEESVLAKEDEEEEGVLWDTIVSGRTDIRLCDKHCSKAGSCRSLECKDLHMCRFYILNECNFEPCLFGHEIGSDHNDQVLHMHLLHELKPRDVGYLMRDVRNRNETTIPKICDYYNIKKNCSRKDCQFLHLCKKFVEEDCKFGNGCKRSHNYFEEQPAQVFERFGILKHDVNRVMELIRKASDKNTLTKAATLMKQTRRFTPKSDTFPSSQGQCNRYFSNENETAFEDNENVIRSTMSLISTGGRITKEEIYSPSHSQSYNSYRSDNKLDLDRYNREAFRSVLLKDGHHNKPSYCYGEPPERKSQKYETSQIHLNEVTHLEDISSDEDDGLNENVISTFMEQERVCVGTSSVSNLKITQKNGRDTKGEALCFVQTVDNQNPKKATCAKSPILGSKTMELKNEIMQRPGFKRKLLRYSLDIFETNQAQIKPKPNKRVCKSVTDKNKESLHSKMYSQPAMDKSSERSENADVTTFVPNNNTNNSSGPNKTESVHNDSHENDKEIYSSTLTTGDKECEWPLDTQQFKVKRVINNKEKSQWTFYSVDTLTSLHMAPEIQDKLEKSYKLFQQQVRKCLIEAFGSRLHVD